MLAAEGNKPAFGQLVDQLAGPILAAIGHVVTERETAERLTQQVLVELRYTAHRYHPADGSVHTWALALAHRHAVAHVRAQPAPRAVVPCTAAHGFDESAFNALTSTQREAILLAYCGGQTYREIASLLELAPETVAEALRESLLFLGERHGAQR
ncbi:sigma factor-like helix-turn-helix DNA-binding protein [Amycolatopsis sp. Hca4]|uniref:sigma factor-like helix-turn-helix DNA-binding protein n=1 Tax=Amycolatopsis sp. Hca4 TaxID=2742131 RepID=UPI0015900417|nr:sigma factor-like helix-turn-helix DNA-binding protein [Amycolatopsis sp. Hca4]QKV73930.1 RNA polymerase subunit sigma [Amycolatopsis sp. Hca4]